MNQCEVREISGESCGGVGTPATLRGVEYIPASEVGTVLTLQSARGMVREAHVCPACWVWLALLGSEDRLPEALGGYLIGS